MKTWLAGCLIAVSSAAEALNTGGSLADLRHTAWGPQSGAPSGNTIAQTTDGYMWLGSQSGLFRFDGLRFERVELPLPSRNVFALFASPKGGLWIGLADGGAVFLKDGEFKTYGVADGLPNGSTMTFAEGADGMVWVGGSGGLARLVGSHWQHIGAEWNFPEAYAYSLMMDSAGTLWAVSVKALLTLPSGAQKFQPVPSPSPADGTFSFAEAPDGRVWVWDEAGIRPIARNENPRHLTPNSGRNFTFDRDGGLWIKNDLGDVRRLANPNETIGKPPLQYEGIPDVFTTKQGFAAGAGPAAITEDREGNIWLFGHLGVDRFSERRLTPLVTDASITPVNTGLAPATEGGVWLSNRDHGGQAYLYRNGRIEPYKDVVATSAIFTAKDGSAWLGGADGLWHESRGKVEHIAPPPTMDGAEIQTIGGDDAGGIWAQFARNPGLFRWADGAWTLAPKSEDALTPGYGRTLATDVMGRLWSGSYKGRVAVLQHGQVKVFPKNDALQLGIVTAIYGQRKNIWFGGELGLAWLDASTLRNILPEAGKEFRGVTGIVEVANGDLWLNDASGISHITAEQLAHAMADPAYRVKVEVLDLLDGFEGTSTRVRPIPTAIEASDGRLWFASSAGIYGLDPTKIVRNPLPPPVAIQDVIADGVSYPLHSEMRLPELTKSIQFDYVGLSLTQAERVRYRYRLEGFDATWQDVRSRRQAFYTNLAPGTYRFHVSATNNDGVWNETGQSVQFTIPPAFVQTRWFVLLCAAAGAVLVWLLIAFRLRQLNARTRSQMEARLSERERIARELHDTLLQGTQGLILEFQLVANKMSRDDPHRRLLEAGLDKADATLAETRERVTGLRMQIDSPTSLQEALNMVANDMSLASPIRCEIASEGPVRQLRSSALEEACSVGREALINAFIHSKATQINVLIIYGADALHLKVVDNGIGIDGATLEALARPGHWGLRGMRERAQALKGRLDVRKTAVGGTEVELCVPSEAAYEGSTMRSRWRGLFGLMGAR